jgi:hypothetical protein
LSSAQQEIQYCRGSRTGRLGRLGIEAVISSDALPSAGNQPTTKNHSHTFLSHWTNTPDYQRRCILRVAFYSERVAMASRLPSDEKYFWRTDSIFSPRRSFNDRYLNFTLEFGLFGNDTISIIRCLQGLIGSITKLTVSDQSIHHDIPGYYSPSWAKLIPSPASKMLFAHLNKDKLIHMRSRSYLRAPENPISSRSIRTFAELRPNVSRHHLHLKTGNDMTEKGRQSG